jgi:protein-L-isoaspartate(D-aspartate) O-methyltransferase
MDYKPYRWTREHQNFVLTESKHRLISNPIVADAFRTVDRADFVPQEFKEFAYEDREIEIGYGEKLIRTSIVAEIVSILNPKPSGRYLEIGSGSGYLLAILSQIVGNSGKAIGLERILALAQKSRNKLEKYNQNNNIEVVFKDGTSETNDIGMFNGIICSARFNEIPEFYKKYLKIDGILIVPLANNDIAIIKRDSSNSYIQEIKPGYIFDNIKEGVE